MKAIAHSYWRLVKAGRRTYESIPVSVQGDVKMLARSDVEDGVISENEYAAYIGEEYGQE